MVHRESNAGNFSQLCARSQRWPTVQLDCSDRFPQGSGKLVSSWKLLDEPVHTPHTQFVQDQYNTTWHSKLKQKFSDHSAPPNLNIKQCWNTLNRIWTTPVRILVSAGSGSPGSHSKSTIMIIYHRAGIFSNWTTWSHCSSDLHKFQQVQSLQEFSLIITFSGYEISVTSELWAQVLPVLPGGSTAS